MTTKRKNIFSFFMLVAVAGLIFSGCSKEDNTGYSTIVPANVTISVEADFTSPVSIVEQDSTFKYTVTLSEAQAVDIKLKVSQIAGTADDHDFDYLHSITIAAGSTTGAGWIKTMPDTDPEGDESFTLQIGDAEVANATFSPVTYEFNLSNASSDALSVYMSWAASNPVYDTEGHEILATAIADLILSLEDATGTPVGGADGSSFEEIMLDNTLADGTYTIKASFYDVLDYGDLASGVSLDVSVDFFQVGVMSESVSYSSIMSTVAPCDFEATLATVTKSGNSYSIEGIGTSEFAVNYGKFLGTYGGVDGSSGDGAAWQLPAAVLMSDNGSSLDVDGINYAWMGGIWGETVTATTPFQMTLNSDGTLTIAEQDYMTTDYDGAAYEYSISGTGTWSACSPSSMVIYYDMYNKTDGFGLGQWLLDNGYSYTNYFIAEIELGAKSAKAVQSVAKIKR